MDLCILKLSARIDHAQSISEIITNEMFELLPQFTRRSWEAVKNDGDKEGSKSIANLHLSCLLKTLPPPIVILQQTQSFACLFVCRIDNTIDCSQILKGQGSRDCGEKQPDIKPLSLPWRSKVHSANSRSTSCSLFLDFGFCIIRSLPREVLASCLPCLLMLPVGLEPSSEGSLL
jgi:hypothetical protein